MGLRRNAGLTLASCAVAAAGFAAAHGFAQATQKPVVVTRFLLGYFDDEDRFVPTAGRGTTNVERNAIAMFIFSGSIDMGPDLRATLPLTIAEQVELDALHSADPDFDAARSDYEPGVIPRKYSTDRTAYFVATGSVSPASVQIGVAQADGSFVRAPGQFFKVLRNRAKATAIKNRLLFNPNYVASTFDEPSRIDRNPPGLEAETRYEVLIDGGRNPLFPFNLLRARDGAPLAARFSTMFATTRGYLEDHTRPEVRATSPAGGASGVDTDAGVEITFSESMETTSFVAPRFQGDTAWTVSLRYTTSPVNGPLQGRFLLVNVFEKPQSGGSAIQILPAQGYGKGPFEVECIVRTGVIDFSGNNLVREIQFAFRTEFDPNAGPAGTVEGP